MQLIWVCRTAAAGKRALNLPIIKPDSHLQQGVAPRWEPVRRELWSAERNCQAININRPNRAGERRSDQNALQGEAQHGGADSAGERAVVHQGNASPYPAAVYLK